jgi:ribosomal protein S18 acetylase RimI-like enzyme
MTQKSDADKIEYRPMVFDDDSYVYDILEAVTSEIPFQLESKDEQDKLKATIIQGRTSGKSLVAVDDNSNVVGFVLARPDAYLSKSAIYIYYVAVLTDSRRRGIFSALMEKMKTDGVPLLANVLNGNLSSMVDILVSNGFTKIEPTPDAQETKLVWLPPVKQKAVSTK